MPDTKLYYKEIEDLFDYKNITNITKRMIDLTLDSEDISFYKKTYDLLKRQENSPNKEDETLLLYKELFFELRTFLEKKPVHPRKKLISINNLIKTYKGKRFSLGPISFDLYEGEIIGLVGENGNGKTTLLRSVCKELKPTKGSIEYNLTYSNDFDLRTQLIYIPQRTKDWHGPLLDNLLFTASSYGIKGKENALLVELVITRMGLRPYKDLKWKELSSGYKMRFELARMLLRKPKLLLIDEPLANLDIVSQQSILDDFRQIAKSPFRPLGFILSSQQLYEVERTSNRVIFLKDGKTNFSNNDWTKEDSENDIPNKFIIEFDCNADLESLKKVFTPLLLEKIQKEGGTYIATFPEIISREAFINTLMNNHIYPGYFRDISKSSRRFFLA